MMRDDRITTSGASLMILALFSCADAPPPRSPRSVVAEEPPSAPERAESSEPELDEPHAPAPPAEPEPPVAPPSLIDVGDLPGRVQACAREARYTSLSKVLAHPEPGRVMVRGRMWIPAIVPCTGSFPEHCYATPVLASTRPSSRRQREISVSGMLTPDTPLMCVGSRDALRCPIPIDGTEYGVTGMLGGPGYEGESPTLEVEHLCRFGRGAGP
jgi:hypothetical protein